MTLATPKELIEAMRFKERWRFARADPLLEEDDGKPQRGWEPPQLLAGHFGKWAQTMVGRAKGRALYSAP
eukprot:6812377-Lingulodinium_polyedra.AAC.1